MFGLGWPELAVVALLVVFVFGASRLPRLGSDLGRGLRNFAKGVTGGGDPEEPDGKEE